ncbi:hypothetical protein KUTeg_025021 [Tegillarca granosa]|uniref:Mitochondria-eating protein C-terminal domain-containing protein n=1 Tax=Tegillarca granosa TaxID=220873 RepID=A0ABQ9DZZ8_TEGGR|nr:hypothetical protein KUTeg_025021 [Tegillarca granosa]
MDGYSSGSVKTIPAGINSLKGIKMLSLSKFIGKLKMTSAIECLEQQDYINMILDIDRDYTDIKSKNADLKAKLEESFTSAVKGVTDNGNSKEQVDNLKKDQTDKTIEVKVEKTEGPQQQGLQDKHQDTEPETKIPKEGEATEGIQREVSQEESRAKEIQLPKPDNKTEDTQLGENRDNEIQVPKPDNETEDTKQGESIAKEIQVPKLDSETEGRKQGENRAKEIQVPKPDNETEDRKQQQEIIDKKNEEIVQLQDKLKEMQTKINDMERQLVTSETAKIESEENFKKLNAKYAQHIKDSQNLIEEYRRDIHRLNQKIDNDSLEIQRYKDEKIKLNEQMNDLKLRLSHIAGSKLSENNPSITDLSDPNRPIKIAEQFSELYDNEWTDALELLQNSGQDERSAVDILQKTLKMCFEFCQVKSEKQQRDLVNALLPTKSHDLSVFTPEVSKSVKDLRKMTDLEEHWVTWLNQEFLTTEEYNSLPEERKKEEFVKFVNICLKCSWLSNVQDPPIVLEFNLGHLSKYDSNYTKAFTKQGEFVDYVVWPCMLRCKGGALLVKGIVQCTNDPGSKSLQVVSSAVDLETTSDITESTEKKVETTPKTGDKDIADQQEKDAENADNASDEIQKTVKDNQQIGTLGDSANKDETETPDTASVDRENEEPDMTKYTADNRGTDCDIEQDSPNDKNVSSKSDDNAVETLTEKIEKNKNNTETTVKQINSTDDNNSETLDVKNKGYGDNTKDKQVETVPNKTVDKNDTKQEVSLSADTSKESEEVNKSDTKQEVQPSADTSKEDEEVNKNDTKQEVSPSADTSKEGVEVNKSDTKQEVSQSAGTSKEGEEMDKSDTKQEVSQSANTSKEGKNVDKSDAKQVSPSADTSKKRKDVDKNDL